MLKPRFRIAWIYLPMNKRAHTIWSWNITMSQIVYRVRYGSPDFIQWVETEYIETDDPCTCRTEYCKDLHCPVPEHKETGAWLRASIKLDEELNGIKSEPFEKVPDRKSVV